LPRVIECYDVSHLQGFATVASMVVFVDGRPDKSRYRTYKVRAPGAAGGGRHNDDFASMYEVLSRRFRRAREGGQDAGTWKLPDLIVVDGGKGQLAMALAAARDVGIDTRPGVGLPIVALAKERDVALEEGPEEGLAAGAPEASEAPSSSEPAPPLEVVPPPVAAKKRGHDGDGSTKPDRVFLPQAKDAIPIRNNSA